jgi:hypothetical protein
VALTVANLALSVSWQTWEPDRAAMAAALGRSQLAPFVSSFLPYLYDSLRFWLPHGLPGVFV